MRLTTVFNKLLSLQGAVVRDVAFGARHLEVTVVRQARKHHCPHCRYATHGSYDEHVASWRHLALGKWSVLIHATVKRIACPEHGVVTEAVPWAASGSRFTLDFEDLVAWLVREMNVTAVTRLVKVAWRTVGRIIRRVVGRKLDAKRLERLYFIGLDEVSYRKGHKYLSVVADHLTGDAVWLGEGHTRATVGKFFEEVGEHSKRIVAVTMDMSPAYIEEVQARVPHATVCFDPFHVVKLANEAVQNVRRTEARERKGTPEAAVLKGSRWALLKTPENLRPDEELKLSTVAAINQRVYRAYLLKEELRALYHCGPEAAERHLGSWSAWASRSKLEPFVKLARTLRKHRDGVLAAIRLGLSNGRLEGLNNKIGVIKRRAYGFHSAAALVAMVYLCCSSIHIDLPT